MLKRGYLILIIGAALVAIGIIITVAYGVGIASDILSESVIMTDVLVDPAESLNHTLSIAVFSHLAGRLWLGDCQHTV